MGKFKTIVSIGAISIVGAMTKVNAQTAQNITYYETRNHCKLIEKQSKVVINHQDTLQIYGLDTIDEGGLRKIICDLGDGHSRLIYDMHFYQQRSWIPPHPFNDTAMASFLIQDAMFWYLYKFYDGIRDDHRRDSIESLLLENRRRAIEYATKYQK